MGRGFRWYGVLLPGAANYHSPILASPYYLLVYLRTSVLCLYDRVILLFVGIAIRRRISWCELWAREHRKASATLRYGGGHAGASSGHGKAPEREYNTLLLPSGAPMPRACTSLSSSDSPISRAIAFRGRSFCVPYQNTRKVLCSSFTTRRQSTI